MITLTNIQKRFGKLEVLKGVTTEIETGAVTAIIGHNGSGKTTLIKSILGLTCADKGTILLNGQPQDRKGHYREQIGYMPQAASFPENLTGAEVIQLLEDLRNDETPRDTSLIDAFRLLPELDKPLRTLSGGNRQKVSAVLAFLFDPAIIILDEPTAGLDPLASGILKDKIREARQAGKTILLTSHIMSEIDELANNVVLLFDGQIHFAGPILELKRQTGHLGLERAIAHLMLEQAA